MYNSNTKITYNAMIEDFKEISEEDYKKIFFNEIQLAEVVGEKEVEKVEQKALEFVDVTPHGHKKDLTIDEFTEEINDYFNPNKAKVE